MDSSKQSGSNRRVERLSDLAGTPSDGPTFSDMDKLYRGPSLSLLGSLAEQGKPIRRLSELMPKTRGLLEAFDQPHASVPRPNLASHSKIPEPVKRRRGRPQKFSDEQIREALKRKAAGANNRKIAQFLHNAKTPTIGQVYGVTKILTERRRKWQRLASAATLK